MLSKKFFDQPTIAVARGLLGKYIVRKYRNKITALMITEVEAYDGPFDLASHGSRGRTPRSNIMFGESGIIYIFFIYGMHWMVNVVTGPKNYPAAVLLRAGQYEDPNNKNITIVKGPGRLAKFLNVSDSLNGKKASKKSGIWFEDRGKKIKTSRIIAAKRIGVDYAGPIWSKKKYNFIVKTNIK